MNTKKTTGDPAQFDWSRFDAISDEQAEANAIADLDSQPKPAGTKPIGVMSRAQVIRRALGQTQQEFSARYQIPLGTLRDWEQHRSEPDQATRAYLKVIAADPEMVARALASKSAA
jgi:putative transcriptional regulator